jgi:hypothetical protein
MSAGGDAGKTPAFFFIENVDQLQQLAGSSRQMRSYFGDLVTEAGEVFNVLEIGVLAWDGADHDGIPQSIL